MWRRVGRNTLIFGGGAMLMAVLQIVFRLLAIDELSVTHYGQVALLISIFNAILLAGQAGVPVAAARLTARIDKAPDRTILANALRATALPCVLASVGMAGVTYAVLGSWEHAALALVGMPPMVLSALCAGFLQGKGRVWGAASVQPVNTIAQLAALCLVIASGTDVGVGWIMTTFYIGNVAALVFGAVSVLRRAEREVPAGPVSEDVAPRQILTFSLYLLMATLAVFLLPVLSRVSVVHISYAEVAFFDLALLLYTIPERLAASLVNALIPIASSEQSMRRTVAIPSRVDVLLLTAGMVVVSLLVWETHVVRDVLEAVGLGHYSAAEKLLLIVMIAAPAELLYMVHQGLLSAFGQTRRLAILTGIVFGIAVVLMPVAAALGTEYLAVLLVGAYWALYLGSDSILPEEHVRRRRLSDWVLGALRSGNRTPQPAHGGKER